MSTAPEPEQRPPSLSWEELVRGLFSTALRHRASVEEAEDLVQETVEVALKSPAWFDPERGTKLAAMRAILRNRLIDRRRHQAVHERSTPHLRLVPTEPDADSLLMEEDARDRRRAFLAQLTPEERQVFQAWLRQRRGDFTATGAAATLDLDVPAYEAAKKRLRRRCHLVLDDLGLEAADLFGGAP